MERFRKNPYGAVQKFPYEAVSKFPYGAVSKIPHEAVSKFSIEKSKMHSTESQKIEPRPMPGVTSNFSHAIHRRASAAPIGRAPGEGRANVR